MNLFSSLIALQLFLSGAATTQPATPTGAAAAIAQASDPSAAVAAYAKALADEPNSNLAIESAYVRRMVDFGVPEMAEAQAQDLVLRDPNNGLAWATLAHANGRRDQTTAALGQIETAVERSPDDAFVQRTAGQLLAWYDTQSPGPVLPDAVERGIPAMRDALRGRDAYVQAYQLAHDAYLADNEADQNPSTQPAQASSAPADATTVPGPMIYDSGAYRPEEPGAYREPGTIYEPSTYDYPPTAVYPAYPAYSYYYPQPFFFADVLVVDRFHDHHRRHHRFNDCLLVPPRHRFDHSSRFDQFNRFDRFSRFDDRRDHFSSRFRFNDLKTQRLLNDRRFDFRNRFDGGTRFNRPDRFDPNRRVDTPLPPDRLGTTIRRDNSSVRRDAPRATAPRATAPPARTARPEMRQPVGPQQRQPAGNTSARGGSSGRSSSGGGGGRSGRR
jgi:hypothetical protein